ncbi:MAG: hypothetical protein EOP32_07510 [Rhodococcus sp. (in: high G+C Gram-positive bacteria)]|nr:MAG: hypothetical protein EOP32_07510 [Rhodococcus sp. (in: high G+C Gram-positive bacteria)]
MPTSTRTRLPHGRVSSDLACREGRAWNEGIGRTVGRPLDGPTHHARTRTRPICQGPHRRGRRTELITSASNLRTSPPHRSADTPAERCSFSRPESRPDATDEQYEGCLTFDIHGLAPRPLDITIETTTLTGELVTTAYDHGLAWLILHEVDHLDGALYRARMRPGIEPTKSSVDHS